MMRVTQILCPVDFSEISQHAFDHAAAIARWYEAHLTLLYVFANLPTMDLPPLVLEDSDRERLTTAMRKMAARVPSGLRIEFRIQEAGYVHDEILRQAADRQSDLIVMGVHGRGAVDRLLFGSATHHVIRAATCPVLIVRGA